MWLKQQEAMLLPASSAAVDDAVASLPNVPSAWIDTPTNDASMVVEAQPASQSGLSEAVVVSPQEARATASPVHGAILGQVGPSLQGMLEHAREGSYAPELTEWANARFGQGWEQEPSQVIEAWSTMVTRLGAMTGQWLHFNCEVLKMNLEQELVLRYMKLKIGALKDGSVIPRYIDELKGLCADGASVATELMHAALENAS
jgi:hypothetical protein